MKTLEEGQILSETQYYIVKKLSGDKVQLQNDEGEFIVVTNDYIEKCTESAHRFSKTEKLTKTQLAELFFANTRRAMTVCFNKQVKEKDVVDEIKSAFSSTPSQLEKQIKLSIKKALNGEERVMVGRHYGSKDDFGRVHFIDMEIEKPSSGYDKRQRLVDPRTINWVIVNNVKYILK
jgi:hypothetical protein